ncbi:MAG: Stk1 family PASTA domain-containing Ser/Thr kinase [Thermoleophilia bacterium]|nr:Stk1 family PASTA domain-containing Ser/Thr kinase [Thermoleophilia bacterium]MBJ7333925.1 Stk1 family PASTA domain-containing Ser/Thr kinase [Thermoleophilia bacterium]
MDDTSPGALFDGRYRIVGRLGQGGMARVFLAQDESLHRQVAVKVLADRHSDDPHFIERFQREARAAARLNHPNIVQVYDQSQTAGMSYIVQEYVEGETLKDLIRRESPIDPRRAITIALQILAALRVAHQQGVIHRDVKPQNILVQPDGKIKVADFGIASAGDTEMTEAGSIVGTAQYLAPEQARGLPVGPPADLYAVGIVLYEMLSGRVPFEGEAAVTVAMRHVQEAPEALTDRNPLVPVALESVVMRALAKDPTQRYQSADQMGIELDRVRQGLPISDETSVIGAATIAMTRLASETLVAPPLPPREPPPTRGGNPNRKRLWILLLVLGVVLLAVVAGVYAFTRGDSAGGGGGGATTASTATTSALVEIPDLVGQTQAAATAALEQLGLVVLITQQTSADAPPGEVIAMRPNPGGEVPTGTTIELQISAGPNLVTVPDVQGADGGDATAQIEVLGLLVSIVEDSSDSVAVGHVISQAPSGGVGVKAGSTVTLTISKGKQTGTVPNITKMDITNAQNTLIAAGLVLGSETQANDAAPVGQVISQDPAAGTILPQGGFVNVVVSKGPVSVSVPSVVNMTRSNAEAQITNAGLVANTQETAVTDPAQDGIVVSQDPASGSSRPQGSTVTIVVGRYSGTTA